MLDTVVSKVQRIGDGKITVKWVPHDIFQLESFCRLRREHIGLVGRFNEQESRLRR